MEAGYRNHRPWISFDAFQGDTRYITVFCSLSCLLDLFPRGQLTHVYTNDHLTIRGLPDSTAAYRRKDFVKENWYKLSIEEARVLEMEEALERNE